MNWGYRIVISFGVFIALIITMVVISMSHDVDLVAPEYYVEEIAYQDQIDRIRRTNALEVEPEINYNPVEGIIDISLNQEQISQGQVIFFRPSNMHLDSQWAINESGKAQVAVGEWQRGRWKVKITWMKNELEYYLEKSVTL